MAYHYCDKEITVLKNSKGQKIDSIKVVCRDCGKSATAFGFRGPSVRKCLVMLGIDSEGPFHVMANPIAHTFSKRKKKEEKDGSAVL